MVYPTEGKTPQHAEYFLKKLSEILRKLVLPWEGKEIPPNMLFAFRIQ